MSATASIDIKIRTVAIPFILNTIKLLLSFGWGFKYNDAVFYLPIGDNDDFDWHKDDITDDDLFDIMREKEKLGELIGVTMMWKNTEIGGDFLFRANGTISVNLSINRKKVKQGFTDVNWYLIRIIPALTTEKITVESIEFYEHV